MDVQSAIAERRRAVAAFLRELTPEQAEAQSLCGEWTVRDVAAHLLMPLVTPLPRVLVTFAASRFDFDKANVKLTAQVATRSVADIAAGLDAKATHPFKPPGRPYEAPLSDVLIHEQDMRVPLGMPHRPPDDPLRTALTYLVTGKSEGIALRRRVNGFRYEATDLDWAAGDGAMVRGPAVSILLAVTGRDVALTDLTGDGVDRLRR